jgi:hypothetical protein
MVARIDVSTPKYPNTWALVDDEDYERVTSLGKWTATPKNGSRLYAVRMDPITNSMQRLHRFVAGLGRDDARVIDHINKNTLDNRKSNLRVVTQQQNTWNSTSRVGSSSRFLGVSWRASRNHWRVRIKKDGQEIFIGHYTSETEAARAYDRAATHHFGPFAALNLPLERAA